MISKKFVRFTMFLALVFVTLFALLGGAGAPKPTIAQDPYAGHTAVLGYAEIITDPASGEAGRIEYFRKDLGNKRLTSDFVYGDPRRMAFNGGYAGVTYAIDTGRPSADANLANQNYWLEQSILEWDVLTCSNLGLQENAVAPGSTGLVIGAPNFYADLTQVGFLPTMAVIGLPANVLGVTFTFVWIDGAGNPTDIDSNGRSDVALREIYYNDAFNWSDNGVLGVRGDGFIDFPAVAIHEVGHGFSQAHFGSIGFKDGVLVANPNAIMNAIYGGIQRQLAGSDRGGHCSNWANWPHQ